MHALEQEAFMDSDQVSTVCPCRSFPALSHVQRFLIPVFFSFQQPVKHLPESCQSLMRGIRGEEGAVLEKSDYARTHLKF